MSAFSAAVLAHTNLVAYWRHGDALAVTADDVGPNNLDGAHVGVATPGVAGGILTDTDTAMGFSGGAGGPYITVPDANPLDLGDGPFTLMALVKRAAISQNAGLICKGSSYRMSIIGNNLVLRNAGSTIVASTVQLLDTTKYHLCAVSKNGTSCKVYIDGADVTGTVTNATIANTTAALILAAETAAANKLNGTQDESCIFSSVLTPTEHTNFWLLARGKAIGIATEADTAIVLGRWKSKAIGIASESDVPLTPDKEKVQSITRGEEVDTAQPLAAEKRKAIGLASEVDTAEPLESVKQRVIGPATETDTAEPLDAQKRKGIGYAEETDEARALARAKSQPISPAVELDEGQALGRAKVRPISPAIEHDEAMPIAMPGQIIVPIGIATETDQAMPLGQVIVPPPPTSPPPRGTTGISPMLPERRILVPKIVPIGIAEEHDEALVLSFEKRPSRNQIDEEELLAIGSL